MARKAYVTKIRNSNIETRNVFKANAANKLEIKIPNDQNKTYICEPGG